MHEIRERFIARLINGASLVLSLIILIYALPLVFNKQSLEFTLYKNSFLNFIDFSFKIDSLAAFFIVLIAAISILSTVFAIKYSEGYSGKYSLINLALFTAVFVFAMMSVVAAASVFCFLVLWEIMSLSSYLLVIYDYENKDSIKAGFVYLVMTHIATALLLIAFLLLSSPSKSLSFMPVIIFAMFSLGSGIKMGIVPFHFWLPLAHPAAPSHVSALMSGLMVKIPLYLLIRVVFDFLHPEMYMGYSILAFGSISALIGVIYAVK
jgi:hydrogenase-4 component B